MKYVWNELKSRNNLKKHKVSFEEAQSVLESGDYLVVVDTNSDEERYKALGMSRLLNLLLVIYTYRDEDFIRIISARKATAKEVKLWQKEK